MDKPAEKAGTNWAEDSGTGYFSTIQVPEFETSLGAVLRQKREARGMTINEVCQRTRIPPDFIKQLESDLYERLPPPVYTRSYIGQLCREYSLNPDLLLQAYDQAQSRRQTGDRGTQPLALVINNDREDGSISYTPIPSSHFPGDNAGWSAHLPRLAIMIATGLLLLLVFSAVVIQQYTNYRLRRGEEMEAPVSGQPAMTSQPATIDLEELVPAQRLPLQELSIPGA